MVSYAKIIFIGLYLILTFIEKLISTVCYLFSYFGVLINCRNLSVNYIICFQHVQKLRQYLYLGFLVSSIPTNWYFLAFFCLTYKFFKSYLEIINLMLDIFRYVNSASITGYLILSYIENLISTECYFFRYFLLVIKLHELNVVLL